MQARIINFPYRRSTQYDVQQLSPVCKRLLNGHQWYAIATNTEFIDGSGFISCELDIGPQTAIMTPGSPAWRSEHASMKPLQPWARKNNLAPLSHVGR